MPMTWDALWAHKAPNGVTMGDVRVRLEDPCPNLDARDDLQSVTQGTVAQLEKWSGQG